MSLLYCIIYAEVNKIKVIKRKAYGFHDLHYFSLKIIQAFIN